MKKVLFAMFLVVFICFTVNVFGMQEGAAVVSAGGIQYYGTSAHYLQHATPTECVKEADQRKRDGFPDSVIKVKYNKTESSEIDGQKISVFAEGEETEAEQITHTPQPQCCSMFDTLFPIGKCVHIY